MSPPWTSPEKYGLSTPWFPLVRFGSLHLPAAPGQPARGDFLRVDPSWGDEVFLLWELLDFCYTLAN